VNQNAHVQMVNMPMPMEDVKIVPTNVQNVQALLKIVILVKTLELCQNVTALLNTGMMEPQYVEIVYQNVKLVKIMKYVPNVKTPEFLLTQMEISMKHAHAQVNNSNLNITVTLVMFNVLNVQDFQIIVTHVLVTENLHPLVVAHTEHLILKKKNVHHVTIIVKHVQEQLIIVKFVLKDIEDHQNVLGFQLLNQQKLKMYQ